MPGVQSTNAPAAPQDTLIARLEGATVILDDRAVLRHVDLDLREGVTVLRGPNGAGKTTALRALAGLTRLARGRRETPSDVLYLGHRPQLLHGLSARENLRFFAAFRGRTRSDGSGSAAGEATAREERIAAALERWGIAGQADRPVERMSAGQRRRAALARLEIEVCALALLDEPFAELDDEASALLRSSVAEAARRSAVLVASHGHAELDATARRVYLLRDGEVVPT
jgi:heme exporter protein A